MNRSHGPQRHGWWSRLCILLTVLAALASVRPAQTAMTMQLVKDINTLTLPSYPSNLTTVGSELYFTANDGSHGAELWKTNGTAAGTSLVKDINPNVTVPPLPPTPPDLRAVGSTLFFTADDGTHGWELWRSDGTAAGTTLVKDINPTAGGSSWPGYLTALVLQRDLVPILLSLP